MHHRVSVRYRRGYNVSKGSFVFFFFSPRTEGTSEDDPLNWRVGELGPKSRLISLQGAGSSPRPPHVALEGRQVRLCSHGVFSLVRAGPFEM